MAYDTTAIVTAIAEGRVSEEEGKALLQEASDLEVKIAKLLSLKHEETGVHEPTPEELAQADIPQAETPAGEPVTEPSNQQSVE